MRKIRVIFALLLGAALVLPAAVLAQTTNSVKGTAVIRQRVTLPNNAVVAFQLVDRSGAAANVIAEQKFTANGKQAPFQFELKYDPAKIQSNGVYAVQGSITVDGQTRYTTTTQYRVITGGNPTSITITLDPVPLPGTSGGTYLPAVAVLLLALVWGIRQLRLRMS